jgi:hypothetical protein
MPGVIDPHVELQKPQGSDRNFGFVFAGVFVVLTLMPLVHGGAPRWWCLVVAAAFGILALVSPKVLHPLNRAWMAFGELLHRVVSPVVLGAVFFLCITPMAWFVRRRGIDPLQLKWRPELKSYWIERTSPLDPQSMKNQY